MFFIHIDKDFIFHFSITKTILVYKKIILFYTWDGVHSIQRRLKKSHVYFAFSLQALNSRDRARGIKVRFSGIHGSKFWSGIFPLIDNQYKTKTDSFFFPRSYTRNHSCVFIFSFLLPDQLTSPMFYTKQVSCEMSVINHKLVKLL